MKRFLCVFVCLVLLSYSVVNVSAKEGNVTYKGKAKGFVFSPGSEYSLTDMFSEFKGVMPGDSLKQKITLKNDAKKDVKVKVYMRSLGAQKKSKDFLSQLKLRIKKSEDNEMAYMFDAAASETSHLTEWNFLGVLYSGGEINLDVFLDVPKELDNKYSNQAGYLDWEFMIEEFPAEDGDPEPPKTGDTTNMLLWAIMMAVSGLMIIILLIKRRKDKKEEETAQI